MRCYSIEPRTRKYFKGNGFLPFARNLFYGKNYCILLRNTGLDTAKTAFKNVVHEIVGATGELIGNKIAEKVVKSKPMLEMNSRKC